MKRISLFVTGLHILALLWMALWMPVKRTVKKPLTIRTIVEAPVQIQTAPLFCSHYSKSSDNSPYEKTYPQKHTSKTKENSSTEKGRNKGTCQKTNDLPLLDQATPRKH